MVDLILIRAKSNPSPEVSKKSDASLKAGRYMPAYGLLSLAGYLRQKGHSVKLFDRYSEQNVSLPPDIVAEKVLTQHPSFVGISAMTSQCKDAMAIGKDLMCKSNTHVIFGGVHFSAVPAEGLKHGHTVVKGEGEHCLHEIMASSHSKTFGKTINGKNLTEEEMDSIPFPKKEDLAETAFDASLVRDFPIITARGCPYNCVFCKDGYRSSKVRFHSVDYVIDFLDYVHRTFGFHKFFILDDVFVYSESRMVEMLTKLEMRNLKLKFRCFIHANIVRPEILKLMHRIGVRWVNLGVEAGNEHILKLIGKGTTIEKIRHAVHLCKKQGLYVNALYMIGNMGETPKTVHDTINLARSLPTDKAWFSFAVPFPGTPFYDKVSQYGRIIEPDFSKWNNETLVYLPKGISLKEMHNLMSKAQLERYFKKLWFVLFGSWVARLREIYYNYF